MSGRVLKFNGTEERHTGRRRVLVAKVRARWPQTVDFEKGELVNKPEEEELVLWPSNYGARNKRDQVRAAAVPAVPVCATPGQHLRVVMNLKCIFKNADIERDRP